MKRLALAALALVAIHGGCAIHIHNTSRSPGQSLEEWHQCGLLRLEFGEAIDLSARCPSGWSEITTEKTLGQLLVTALSFTLYDPWAVHISCNKPEATR